MRIEPAELAFDDEGTPFSRAYGDVYHSAASGPGQAYHVFVRGNDLPRRWKDQRAFTVLETGFGLGLNFLATWQQWRQDPARSERLHFVSVEKHPFRREALSTLHARYGDFAPLAAQLRDSWPPLVPGIHRLHFEGERVTLTLALGDVAELLPRLRLLADAIYLDGFAPDRNAEMWSEQLMKRLARLARPGTTVSTYSAAGAVRRALEAAGFQLEKRPGFGRKREMLCGHFAPRWPSRRPAPAAPPGTERRAIVVGAGLAGAAISERLAVRGWQIDLIERRPLQAMHPPGMYAGVFHPHISRDDCLLSRLARHGFLHSVTRWLALERAGERLAWERCGALQLARDPEQEQSMANAIGALGYPPDYAEYVGREKAGALSGRPLRGGGWWFPEGGWMRPAYLIAAQLTAAENLGRDRPALIRHFGAAVQTIAHSGGEWQAFAADGTAIARAPVLVLATSNDLTRLASVAQPLRRIRGQVSYLPAACLRAPRAVVTGGGYVLPAVEGTVVAGSTYDVDDDDPAPQLRGHEANLMRLSRMFADDPALPDASRLDGAVGFRCVAPDHMPLIGALPDLNAACVAQAALSGAQLADLPRCPALYCASGYASRGLIWATLGAEMLASQLEGVPLPIEGDLADAIDPGRFVLRQVRRGLL